MAVSVSSDILERGKIIGGIRMTVARLTLGSASAKTYTTGGISISPSVVGLCSISELISMSPTVGGYVTEWDPVNKKLKLYITDDATGTAVAASAGTPSGTLSLSSMAAIGSVVDRTCYTLPNITLTHSASPGGAGTLATPLCITQCVGSGMMVGGALLSDNNGGNSAKGATANGSIYGVASPLWFWVQHDDLAEINGAQIYVQENKSYRLAADLSAIFGSSVSEACFPMYWQTSPVPMIVAVKVTHVAGISESTDTKKLYFDDDGAAGSQLLFTASDSSNHNIPSSSVIECGALCYTAAGGASVTTIGLFTGRALAEHTHTVTTSGGGLSELPNGTDIGAGTLSLDVIAVGV